MQRTDALSVRLKHFGRTRMGSLRTTKSDHGVGRVTETGFELPSEETVNETGQDI